MKRNDLIEVERERRVKQMWKKYEVELKFTTPFASSTPKNLKDIEAMLIARAPSEPSLKKRMEAGEVMCSEVG